MNDSLCNGLSGRYRRRPGCPQVVRVPPVKPGEWVREKGGRVFQVRSLTCAITERQHKPRWRLHSHDDRWYWWQDIEGVVPAPQGAAEARLARNCGATATSHSGPEEPSGWARREAWDLEEERARA